MGRRARAAAVLTLTLGVRNMVCGKEIIGGASNSRAWTQTLVSLLPPLTGDNEADLIQRQLDWKHDLLLWAVPAEAKAQVPEVLKSYAVNTVLGLVMYMVLASLWACFVFHPRYGARRDSVPAWADLWAQMKVSLKAIPLYTLLPPFAEWLVREGYTLTYADPSRVGLPTYCLYLVLYMVSVEFGWYWLHRKLHEVKLGYKLLHATHHKFNNEHAMSPFAGLAFDPLDGTLQLAPYVWTLALVPMHFLTFEILLFANVVWTTNTHDGIYGGGEPLLGAGYHLIHHTTYQHNYGHYTTTFDWMFGTLKRPPTFKNTRKVASKS